VADIKNHGSNVAIKPEMYFLLSDQPFQIWVDLRSMTLVIRTASEPAQMVSAIRSQLKQLDPELPIYRGLDTERACLIVHFANQVSRAHAVSARVRRTAAGRNRSVRSSRLHRCAKQA
jgi:hypothetical protein